jgi:anthranilate phosphoribosyltransferase
MRRRAKHVRLAFESGGPRPGDTCGTGGDTIPTFNVSTAIMFLLAAEGLPIAKHGNRAFTSRCGSADVLQELGAEIQLTPEQVRACIERTGIGFMFAPAFHGATARVRNVRAILAQDASAGAKRKTVFNVLGPLSNPAEAPWQLMGVYNGDFLAKIAEVLRRLGVERAAVVHGLPPAGLDGKGLDEASTLGPTAMAILKDGAIREMRVEPADFGLAPARAADLAGGDARENAATLRGILSGEIKGPKRELILANAAAARIVGRGLEMNAANLKEGVGLFAELLDNGAAAEKLRAFVAATRSVSAR